MLIHKLKQWWHSQDHVWHDPLVEGWHADQYQDPEIRARIRAEYRERYLHQANPTPATHPWLYDPVEPPQGWRYDPYYEIWIKS